MWYNASTGAMQSNDPGEGCFGELLAERREGWEWKPDGWRPERSTQAKVADAMRPYQAELAGLLKAKAMAESLGNPTTTITTRYSAVMADMKAAIQAMTGTSE